MSNHDEIRIFANVVEHAGFAAAAKSLEVTRSAVCRRIDRLERRLGVRLLDRTTRRITLTDAGEAFYQRSVRILADIAEAETVASEYGGEPQGVLRVTSPIMIGLHKVIPLLPEFLKQYRHIKLQLSLSDDFDAALADHDVAIRWSEQQPSALIITRLTASRQIICASPSYLSRHGTPQAPSDLLRHNCLMMTRLGLTHNEWEFRGPKGPLAVKVSGNFVVNGGHGNYEALIAGLGIGRVTDLRVRDDIEAGRLQRVLRDYEPRNATAIYAAYKRGRLVPPKVRCFITFMRERLRATEMQDS